MITYQDFVEYGGVQDAVIYAIRQWQEDRMYKTACIANLYERQQNKTIMEVVPKIYSVTGVQMEDKYATNNKIASNFFHRLNTQRCTYSLGNGITFSKGGIKERFGPQFDTVLMTAGYNGLIHGLSFLFLSDRVYEFDATEFAPLWDEDTGELKAGVRWWQIANDKPLYAVLYEEDGYTKFRKSAKDAETVIIEPKRGYIQHIQTSEADGVEVIGEDNYGALPIVPLWGSKLHQSTLVGMRASIDIYDIVRSGFANDLKDCAEIYWVVENFGGMQPQDLAEFIAKMKLHHVVQADTTQGGKVSPYTQQIPYEARKVFLDDMRAAIYEDFGGLDVHTVAAGATNDHIEAAYQPMDENADDFEAQIIEAVQRLGALLGIAEEVAIPLFKRNRISNQREQVEMLVQEAEWLDEQTILEKLPNITADEVDQILKRKDAEDMERMARDPFMNQDNAEDEESDDEVNNG